MSKKKNLSITTILFGVLFAFLYGGIEDIDNANEWSALLQKLEDTKYFNSVKLDEIYSDVETVDVNDLITLIVSDGIEEKRIKGKELFAEDFLERVLYTHGSSIVYSINKNGDLNISIPEIGGPYEDSENFYHNFILPKSELLKTEIGRAFYDQDSGWSPRNQLLIKPQNGELYIQVRNYIEPELTDRVEYQNHLVVTSYFGKISPTGEIEKILDENKLRDLFSNLDIPAQDTLAVLDFNVLENGDIAIQIMQSVDRNRLTDEELEYQDQLLSQSYPKYYLHRYQKGEFEVLDTLSKDLVIKDMAYISDTNSVGFALQRKSLNLDNESVNEFFVTYDFETGEMTNHFSHQTLPNSMEAEIKVIGSLTSFSIINYWRDDISEDLEKNMPEGFTQKNIYTQVFLQTTTEGVKSIGAVKFDNPDYWIRDYHYHINGEDYIGLIGYIHHGDGEVEKEVKSMIHIPETFTNGSFSDFVYRLYHDINPADLSILYLGENTTELDISAESENG